MVGGNLAARVPGRMNVLAARRMFSRPTFIRRQGVPSLAQQNVPGCFLACMAYYTSKGVFGREGASAHRAQSGHHRGTGPFIQYFQKNVGGGTRIRHACARVRADGHNSPSPNPLPPAPRKALDKRKRKRNREDGHAVPKRWAEWGTLICRGESPYVEQTVRGTNKLLKTTPQALPALRRLACSV